MCYHCVCCSDANLANDECDFGYSLQLGLNLLAEGPTFRNAGMRLTVPDCFSDSGCVCSDSTHEFADGVRAAWRGRVGKPSGVN